MNIVFFCSGNGGNLRYLFKIQEILGISIVGVLIHKECGAAEFARDNNIPVYSNPFDRSKESDEKIVQILLRHKTELVITTINRIISHRLISYNHIKFINLHYSILPAYKGLIGLSPLYKAQERSNTFSGATCHYVTEEVDDGHTISQGIFTINEPDTSSEIVLTNFQCGFLTLVSGILVIINTDISNSRSNQWKNIIVNPGMNRIILEKIILNFET